MRARNLLWAFALVACSKGSSASDSQVGEVLAGWQRAGLQPSAFTPAEAKALGAKACQSGTVNGLETTVCEYADEASARAAEKAGLTRVGETTGLAVAHGKVLLVVADRKNADPNGRRINDMVKAFQTK